jgi:hypothetical protein
LNEQWVGQQPDLLLLGLAQFTATNPETQVKVVLKLGGYEKLIKKLL